MEFCDKCGSVFVAKEQHGKTVLICRKCDRKAKEYTPLQVSENIHKRPIESDVIIIEKDAEALPKTKTDCPQCGHKEAVWWIQQTRSADEAPTLFLRCTKCKHSWREYG